MRRRDSYLHADLLLPGLGHLLEGRFEQGLGWLLGAAFFLVGSFVLVPYVLTSGLHPRLVALDEPSAVLLLVLPVGHAVFASFLAVPMVLVPGLCGLIRTRGEAVFEGLVDDDAWRPDSLLGYSAAVLLVALTFVGAGLLAPRFGFAVGFGGHVVGVLLGWRVLRRRRAALGAAVAVWLAGWTGAALPTEVNAWFASSWAPTTIPVGEAPAQATRTTLVLAGAELGRPIGYAQRYIPETYDSGRMLLDYYLVPLLPSGWADGDPVPAWAALITSQEEDIRSLIAMRAAFEDRDPRGYVLRPPFADEMDEAFGNAARKGLVSAPGAPLVRLSAHPIADLERRSRCALAYLVALLLLVVVEPVVLGIVRRRRADGVRAVPGPREGRVDRVA